MKHSVIRLISMLLLLFLLASCTEKGGEGRSFTDMDGNSVVLPEGPIRVTANSSWITTQAVMVAGAESVAIAPASYQSGHTETFLDLFEGAGDVPLTTGDTISAEAMLEKGVNVFLASNEEERVEYSNAGIPSIVMRYDTTENVAESFAVLGELFGGGALARGQYLRDYILSCAETAKQAAETVEHRPKVYCVAANTQSTPYVTQGADTFAAGLLSLCGGELVTAGNGIYVTISAEFLLSEDPDIIILDGYLAGEALQELQNDPVLKNLRAVRENQIIIAPIGQLRPVLRPGAEVGIGILWLAEQLCGADLNSAEKAVELYRECFGWEVPKEEIELMLEGGLT